MLVAGEYDAHTGTPEQVHEVSQFLAGGRMPRTSVVGRMVEIRNLPSRLRFSQVLLQPVVLVAVLEEQGSRGSLLRIRGRVKGEEIRQSAVTETVVPGWLGAGKEKVIQ